MATTSPATPTGASQNQADELHNRVVQPIEEIEDVLSLFAERRQNSPEKEREDDNRQHVALGHGRHDVRREEIQNHIGDGDVIAVFREALDHVRIRTGQHSPHPGAGLDRRDEQQAKSHREARRDDVVSQRPEPDAADAPDVAQGADAHDNRGQNQRHNNHAQGTQEELAEEIADGDDNLVGGPEFRVGGVPEVTNPDDNPGQNETGDNQDQNQIRMSGGEHGGRPFLRSQPLCTETRRRPVAERLQFIRNCRKNAIR